MIKFFSNPIMSYLEDDVNSFMEKQKMNIIDIKYNTTQYNDELVHSVLIYYEDNSNFISANMEQGRYERSNY